MTKDELYDVLHRCEEFQWEVQGFGMLRTYLPGEGEPRLQIWDPRLQVFGNNAVHDHPWNFTSQIIVGTIYNERFKPYVYYKDPEPVRRPERYNAVQIVPGVGGGVVNDPTTMWLQSQGIEIYQCGDEYKQDRRELHITRYEPLTVTLLERSDRRENVAHSCWKGRAEWLFYEPRPATWKEVNRVVPDVLNKWWM